MKSNKIYNLSLAAAVAMATVACDPKIDEPTPSKGNADFSKYVALGNSLTAGYADGALYKSGQDNSYTNIIATQMKAAGGGEFKIPYIKDDEGIGGFGATTPFGIPRLHLIAKADCKGVISLAPSIKRLPYNQSEFGAYLALPAGVAGPFNNLGVPGAKSYHLGVDGYGNSAGLALGLANPFFVRFATSATTSVIKDALVQNPTFFSIWIGNNDVLGYATAGGTGNPTPGLNPATYNGNDISDSSVVRGTIENYIKALQAGAAKPKGVIANIPDVLAAPYFNTVRWNALPLDTGSAAALNAAYAAVPSSIVTRFKVGNNALIIQDAMSPVGFRSIKSTEYLILTTPSDSIKCAGWGSRKPIPANYVLDATEVSNVTSAIAKYNAAIKYLANKYGLAHVDIYTLIKTKIGTAGYAKDGVATTTTFASGGAFSLDGIHLTPRGNAIVANEFIEQINATHKSTLSPVNISNYNGVIFPQ